jgi:site-specific DNA-methyltransferase (adenine-specific)
MQEWHEAWAYEALRVLSPGGHLLAFGGTRTFHRLTSALEDTGFEIRDCLCWLYGTGFPKSLNVAAAIDKADGHPCTHPDGPYQPCSDAAAAWQGWGTGLKPAWEPIILARKPMGGTVAQNVRRYKTGALNIDGCRIAFRSDVDESESKTKNRHADLKSGARENRIYGRDKRARSACGNYNPPGRWPANLLLSHTDDCRHIDHRHGAQAQTADIGLARHRDCSSCCPVGLLDQQGGISSAGFGDIGGASRFFYCTKASRAERNAGLGKNDASASQTLNTHPTVKPIELMRWLVRLVTPREGTVLDPFAGSGSTGAAAVLEGARFLGIEREPDYVPIARARIRHWARTTARSNQ